MTKADNFVPDAGVGTLHDCDFLKEVPIDKSKPSKATATSGVHGITTWAWRSRASAVKQYLVSLGVSAARLSTVAPAREALCNQK